MKTQTSVINDDFDDPLITIEEDEEAREEDFWFLPGPLEEEPDDLPPGPRAEPPDTAVIEDWAKAQSVHAARLARVAGRLGALDDRLLRGPEGWRHRLALIEASDLSWFAGDRVSSDRLALWISMRLSGAQDDPYALARVGWAVRRLTGGPGPTGDLAAFLDRRDPENIEGSAERFEDRAGGWLGVMTAADELHPITRACMGFHLWSLAGLGQHGDQMEAAVTASRIAASDGSGAIFAPLAMGGGAACFGLAARTFGPLAGWDEQRNSNGDASSRWYPNMECSGGRSHVSAFGQNSGRSSVCVDRVAFGVGPDGGGPNRRKSRGRSKEPSMDGRARPDPRSDATSTIQDVADQGLDRFDQMGLPH